MSRPFQFLAVLLLAVSSSFANAYEIVVDQRKLSIPAPAGFVELTPAMSPYYDAMWAYVAASNTRYLTLIEEAAADAMLRGEDVDVGRYLNIETQTAISRMSITTAQFGEYRDVMRDQLFNMIEQVQNQFPEITDAGNTSLSEKYDAELAVQLGGMVPLPIHLDTDNAIASSMYMTVGATVDGEDMGSDVLAATMLSLHVKDKVLFVYAFGPEKDLEWTRAAASTWATRIVAANSPAGAPANSRATQEKQ